MDEDNPQEIINQGFKDALTNQSTKVDSILAIMENLTTQVTQLARRPNPQPILPPQPILQDTIPRVTEGFTLATPPSVTKHSNPMKEAFNSTMLKELSKRVYTFPKTYKLLGPDNFDQWKQALTIIFRAISFAKFIEKPSLSYSLPDSEAAIILMILRDSCSPGLQRAVS